MHFGGQYTIKYLGRQNDNQFLIKIWIKHNRMLIYSNILIWSHKFLTSTTFYKLLKSYTMPNLRKMEIFIDFNGNLGHLCGVNTHKLASECHWNLYRYLETLFSSNEFMPINFGIVFRSNQMVLLLCLNASFISSSKVEKHVTWEATIENTDSVSLEFKLYLTDIGTRPDFSKIKT